MEDNSLHTLFEAFFIILYLLSGIYTFVEHTYQSSLNHYNNKMQKDMLIFIFH